MSGLSVCVILCCNRVRFFGSFLREWGFSCCLFEKFDDIFAVFSVFLFEVFFIYFDFLNFFCSVVGFFDEFGDVDFGYCSVCYSGINTFYSKGSDCFLFFYAVFSNGGLRVRRFREKFGK